MNVGFIGAGNMAKAIIVGMIDAKLPADHIMASNRSQPKLTQLAEQTGILIGDNKAVVEFADVLVLAVKPQMMFEVIEPLIADIIKRNSLVITIAAGLTTESYLVKLGSHTRLVRAMPNTPTLVKAGVTGLYCSPQVSDQDRAHVDQVFAPLGLVRWLDHESEIDDIIAIAGSSPAYFFLFLEAMQAEAESYGISPSDARQLVAQAGLGAMKLAAESTESFATLKQNVMSKGGTTEQAIFSFENSDIRGTVSKAMQACKQRAKEMAANN